MSRRLTFDEAKILIEREVLGVGKSLVCIDGLSKYEYDNYDIRNIIIGQSDIIVKVAKLDETKEYITSYKFIRSISDMPIDRLLDSLGIDSNKIIEINEYTDVEQDVIGHQEAFIGEIELLPGTKIYLNADACEKYCKKILTVKLDDNECIKLVANRGRPKKIR